MHQYLHTESHLPNILQTNLDLRNTLFIKKSKNSVHVGTPAGWKYAIDVNQ